MPGFGGVGYLMKPAPLTYWFFWLSTLMLAAGTPQELFRSQGSAVEVIKLGLFQAYAGRHQ